MTLSDGLKKYKDYRSPCPLLVVSPKGLGPQSASESLVGQGQQLGLGLGETPVERILLVLISAIPKTSQFTHENVENTRPIFL